MSLLSRECPVFRPYCHKIYIWLEGKTPMVKTTIILEDDLYKELVKEALERYGTTRKLSKLINEMLRE
ncbi:MAG: hypothetical protein DRJ49_07470, partial [Thermoprotei archaeon]